MRKTVEFKPNTPVTVALEFRRGRKLRSGLILFLLTDKRMMFLEPYTAWKISQMKLEPGEAFTVCKLWNGVTGSGCLVRWDVNRVAQSTSKVVRMPFPVPAVASTGTYGPQRVVPMSGGNPPSDGRIPLDVAFREALRIVHSSGVVWGDEAKAAAVATILKVASEAGWLAPWERDAA